MRWDLRVTRTDRVEAWIGFLQGRNRDETGLWLERSGRYAPMIRQALRERGMPENLVYLAFIESGFPPRAYSRQGRGDLAVHRGDRSPVRPRGVELR